MSWNGYYGTALFETAATTATSWFKLVHSSHTADVDFAKREGEGEGETQTAL